MRRRLFALWLILALCAALSAPAAADGGQTITLMVYMCGSNLESGSAAATADLMEMANSGYDHRKINLLVMTGGTTQWSLGLPTDALCIYQPGRGTMRMLYAFEPMNMGEPDALTALLCYGFEQHPADRYGLILWDHGGGPLRGVCWDEIYGGDSLSMDELTYALSQSPAMTRRLDFIGFDACLMASTEVAALMAPFARYMIASEETEPGHGWDYAFLQGLESDPDGAAIGRRIVDQYFAAGTDTADMTLSCVDLDAVGALTTALDGFFGGLEISGGNYALFSYAAHNTRAYGRASSGSGGYDLIDLNALIGQLRDRDPDGAAAAEAAVSAAVVYSRSGDARSSGLSVYHPYENKADYAQSWAEAYPALRFSDGYTGYVQRFASYLFGSQDISWAELSATRTDQESVYALPLSTSQREMLSSAQMRLLRWDEALQAYAPAGTVASLSLDGDTLYAAYPRQSLCVVDPQGQIVGSCVPYQLTDEAGGFGVYVNLCAPGREASDEAARIVPVDTSGERKTFGGDEIDIVTPGTASSSSGGVSSGSVSTTGSASDAVITTSQTTDLGEALDLQIGGTVTLTAPRQAVDLAESVSVPRDVAMGLSQISASAAMTGQNTLNAPPVETTAQVTPVAFTTGAVGSGELSYASSQVALDSYATIDVDTFDASVVDVDLSGYEPAAPTEAGADVVHLWLRCALDDQGRAVVSEIWRYDQATDRWSTGEMPDRAAYPTAVFPAPWLQPVTDPSGALLGPDDWAVAAVAPVCAAGGDWSLMLRPLANEDICLVFVVTDAQNLDHASEPLLVGAPQ